MISAESTTGLVIGGSALNQLLSKNQLLAVQLTLWSDLPLPFNFLYRLLADAGILLAHQFITVFAAFGEGRITPFNSKPSRASVVSDAQFYLKVDTELSGPTALTSGEDRLVRSRRSSPSSRKFSPLTDPRLTCDLSDGPLGKRKFNRGTVNQRRH